MKMTDADLADSLRQIEAAEFKLRGVLPADVREVLLAAAARLAADQQKGGGGGMLPDALVPHATEWYRLCERRFAVERMTISGELAEAIVEAIGQTPQPSIPAPAQQDGKASGGEVTIWLRAEDVADLAADKPWTAGAVSTFSQRQTDEFSVAAITKDQ